MEPNEQLEIQLGHFCNNRCVFCVSGQMSELKRAAHIDAAKVCVELERGRERGIKKVTFLGGEPTLQRSFFEVVSRAVELGYEEVVLFTNGARLRDRRFVERVLALGDRFVWRMSLQGGNEQAHDSTVRREGAFARILAAFELLTELNQPITCNLCVVKQNYESMAELPALVRRFPIRQVHLDMVRPRDAGDRSEDYLDSLLPDYSDLARVLRLMLEGFEELDPRFDVNVGNLPYCLMPEWAHKIHHDGEMTLTVAVDGEDRLSEAWDKYEDKRTDKLKLDSCRECVFDDRCNGFFDLYARRRGVKEFQPVQRQRLSEIDPLQRLFVMHVEPALQAAAEDPPAGWSTVGRVDDDFARRVRLSWSREGGGSATLLLAPAAAPGGGDGEHSAFILRLERFEGVPDGEVYALALSCFDTMVSALDGTAGARPTPARIRARRAVIGKESPVPGIVQKRLRLLMGRRDYAGWALAAAEPVFDPAGARLLFRAPDGRGALLTLAEATPGRVQVGWDLPDDGDRDGLRRVTEAVGAALRGRRR